MAHLRLLLSHSRRHPQPYRLLPLFHFSSDSNSSSAPRPPPPPIKPVSYAPKSKQETPAPDESAAPPASEDGRDPQSPLPRRPQQQQMPPREWTRQDMRYVKDAAPMISAVSYPSKVAPLPEERPAGGEAEAVPEDGLRGEGARIQMDAARARSIFGVPVEDEQVPYPTIIPVVKRPQKAAIDLVDAIRLVKVC